MLLIASESWWMSLNGAMKKGEHRSVPQCEDALVLRLETMVNC